MKKRFLALMLVMAMVLGMSTTVFAEKTDDYAASLDKEPVISKTYVVENGTAPAETFTYTFEGQSFVNNDGETVADATIPSIANQTISFDAISATETKTVKFDINADAYDLGVYTYKVKEVAGNTTGVTYSDEDLYLVLTILRDEENGKHYVGAMHYESATGEDKETGFTNYYDAGSLEVSKTITGNSADMTKKFDFSIIFKVPEGTKLNSTIKVTTPTSSYDMTLTGTTGEVKFTGDSAIKLGHGESVKFENLPEGVTYTVSENSENYKQNSVKYNDEEYVTEDTVEDIVLTGEINGTTGGNVEEDTAAYENNLTNKVDTGIFTTNMPYILALVAIAAVAVVLFRRKREF